MKYISFFSGIGGNELGIGDMGECIGYSEIDKYAIQIYQKHFPNHKNYGDITKITASALPDFDLIVGGFPCQAFSLAGQRKGFDDKRGILFFDIARIVKEKRPKYILLENVKGLLSHDAGRTFKTIIAALDELRYDLQWQVLNSKDFGVPQRRERVFIVGHLRGTPRPQIFPFEKNNRGDEKKAEGTGETSLCLSTRGGERYDPTAHTYIANTISTKQNAPSRTQCRNYENMIAVKTLTGGGHSGGLHSDMTLIGTLRTHKDGNGFRKIKGDVSPTIPARAREDGSGQPVIKQGMKIRRLTPLECERLQGFPDGWTEGISDSQRYKCLGNAVTVNVVREIIKNLIFKQCKK